MEEQLLMHVSALRDKAFVIAKNLEHDGYERGLVSVVYKCFGKTSAVTSANKFTTHTGKGLHSQNQQLAEELHKLIIRKLKMFKF